MERKTKSGNQYGASNSNGFQQHNSKKDDFQEKKKHNRDEETYFEGTGRGKRERVRKFRPVTSTAAVIPPGYTEETINRPPPVNAWQKKKGSDLFVKREDDEEDLMLKQALEESLRTAEDEKNNRERMRMYNFGITSSLEKYGGKGETWENEHRKSENSRFSNSKTELHFVDTSDSQDEIPPTRKHHQANHQQGDSFKSHNKSNSSIDEDYDYDEGVEVDETTLSREKADGRDSNYNKEKHISYSTDSNSTNYQNLPVTGSRNSYNPQNCATEFVEAQPKYPKSQPIDVTNNSVTDSSDYEIEYEPSRPESYNSNLHPTNQMSKSKQCLNEDDNIQDLSESVKSSLSLKSAGVIFDSAQANDLYPSENPILPETSSVYAAKSKEPTLPLVIAQSLEQFPYSSPTDILLHKFIKQEPPSNHLTDNVNQQLLDGKHFHSGMPKVESQELSPPLSNSSAQNSPFGSLENYASPGILGGTNLPSQLPFQYPYNLLGNNDGSFPNAQSNQTFASQLPLSTMPPGYGPSNLINSAISQVGAANPSMMPPFNDPRTNPNMISALGSKIMNPGMVPSFDSPVSNPNVMSSLTHVTNAPMLSSINKMANSNLATMQSNPMMDPSTIAGLPNPSAYQNMVSSMEDQSSRLFQAQMLANAGYVSQLHYQNHLAALSNLDTNEALRNTQQNFVSINQSHMLSNDAPKLMSQNSGDSQMTGTLHMQSMQDPQSQPNPPLKEFPSQTHIPSQSQGDGSDSTQAELLQKLAQMVKDMAELHKQLKPAEPLSAPTLPNSYLPGVAAAPLPIHSQQLMYSGQPMMGLGNYYSGMSMLAPVAQGPQPQPASNLHHPGVYNLPHDRPDVTGEPAGLGMNRLP